MKNSPRESDESPITIAVRFAPLYDVETHELMGTIGVYQMGKQLYATFMEINVITGEWQFCLPPPPFLSNPHHLLFVEQRLAEAAIEFTPEPMRLYAIPVQRVSGGTKYQN